MRIYLLNYHNLFIQYILNGKLRDSKCFPYGRTVNRAKLILIMHSSQARKDNGRVVLGWWPWRETNALHMQSDQPARSSQPAGTRPITNERAMLLFMCDVIIILTGLTFHEKYLSYIYSCIIYQLNLEHAFCVLIKLNIVN